MVIDNQASHTSGKACQTYQNQTTPANAAHSKQSIEGDTCLQLGLCCFVVGCYCLHEAKTRVLDLLQIFVLLLVCFCVLLLQTLHKLLKVRLELLHGGCLLGDG